jgi:NTP pyrophosphatase (non-canonical NTP hydrolase)
MNFKEYQERSRKTAIYPDIDSNYIYPTLGLLGESGEIAEKIKKVMRDDNNIINPEKKEEIKKELGDVLWYLSQIASELNISLEDVAYKNIEKLNSRLKRNVIKGSGDNR